ncbi:hypothetical protein AZOA_37710 [Azoarcus sp. Aa7]|nr:hypothetical protein [Azoarcus sp. Aa7]
MKFETTLLAIAATTFATLAGSALAASDSARGAGRARAPMAPQVSAPAAKGGCMASPTLAVAGLPATDGAAPVASKRMKTARGAGRARASAETRRLVAAGSCEKIAGDVLPDKPETVPTGLPPSKGAKGAGRARAPSTTKPLNAWRG